jgi:hypothetical protein
MELILYFKDIGEMEIQLRNGRRLIATLDFSFRGNLDDLLISSVDKILKENRIEALSLKTMRIGGKVDRNSSAYKIALAFIKAWKSAKMVGF